MSTAKDPSCSPERDLIFVEPVFHGKIWGGRRLQEEFGYQIPDGPVGECWAISAHPAGDCRVASGAFEGKRLSELWDGHRELFGGATGDRFPLLVKILDAEGDLSIQVHPDDAYAAEHEGGSLGKCECWYVLHADPGATIVVGQRARSREEFARKVEEGDWDGLLNEVPVHTGDFFQIDPGTVHAIKAGTMVLETQQSSDVTYRVWDYDRLQADGSKRELHLAQSLDVIDYDAEPISSGHVDAREADGVTELVSCERYAVERVRVAGERTLPPFRDFACASVVDGTGSAGGHAVGKGDHFVVPSGHGGLALAGRMELVVSYVPR
ncbi:MULTISPECIES: type I phosphomannose isomerase catalytic subunit [Olsenella]|uniref:type I phosphomannose isomerase catalytic subunit n=1 Tax=Olsenella TaxID=133925 RepID=UPI0007821163|nr:MULTISPECIES: type I phosphomannose isomerase catalytic subunit [Olsenella]KXB62808.1 mannose-6-phosphate isomerase, class I [Olsenella sp. DNF00959]